MTVTKEYRSVKVSGASHANDVHCRSSKVRGCDIALPDPYVVPKMEQE